MKRFIVSNVEITGYNTGASVDNVQPVISLQTVNFGSGVNGGRVIYRTTRRVPIDPLAVFVTELGIGLRQYTNLICAGDLELGINEKAIWNKASDPGFTLEHHMSVFPRGATPGLASGKATALFRALYYL